MIAEKRKAPRFVPRGNSFVAIGHEFVQVGMIVDIGTHGLAFEHIADERIENTEHLQADVFLAGDKFYLSRIPCTIVYDRPLGSNESLCNKSSPRRCGLVFGPLSIGQSTKLAFFLENLTKPSEA